MELVSFSLLNRFLTVVASFVLPSLLTYTIKMSPYVSFLIQNPHFSHLDVQKCNIRWTINTWCMVECQYSTSNLWFVILCLAVLRIQWDSLFSPFPCLFCGQWHWRNQWVLCHFRSRIQNEGILLMFIFWSYHLLRTCCTLLKIPRQLFYHYSVLQILWGPERGREISLGRPLGTWEHCGWVRMKLNYMDPTSPFTSAHFERIGNTW